MPIECVSKMLDHTNIKTTQLYARITDQKIGGDMDNLAAKIGGQQMAGVDSFSCRMSVIWVSSETGARLRWSSS